MEIRYNDKICIYTPLISKLSDFECEKLFKKMEGDSRKIALDLGYTSDITIDFIERIKNLCTKREIGIFNISSDIFALFNFMKIDKSARLFVSELDFEEDCRQLLNRSFSIV